MKKISVRLKYFSFGLLYLISLAGGIFLPANRAFATGGGGTQGSATTLTALASVSSASTISNVTTAVQSFLNQYTSVTISTSTVNMPGYTNGCGWGVGNVLTNSDFSTYQQFGTVLIEELSKYTTTWLVGPLELDVVSAMGGACTGAHNILLDNSMGNEDYRMRFVLNHELGHYLLGHTSSMKIDSNAWTSNNPTGFSYSDYTKWANTFTTAAHPLNGFVSAYASAALVEDQAETYATIMDTYSQTNLTSWLSSDSNLTGKVNLIKAYFNSVDPSMNSTYFSNIFAYANTNDTHYSVPFPGPGTQSIDEQGNILWTIPSSVNTSVGFTVGIVGNPNLTDTTVMDGKLHGGILPVIDVIQGGTLKGSGSADYITIETGGVLSPGHSPGCMQVTGGGLTINGSLDEEIGGTAACTGYDQMQVTGTVDVTGGTLNTTLYNGYKPKAGESYTIIDNDGSDGVTGTFNGLPEDATFNVSGDVFKISYKGGDGNDVVLSVVSVPATPNTGYAVINNNPTLTAGAAILAAGTILAIARQTKRNQSIKW